MSQGSSAVEATSPTRKLAALGVAYSATCGIYAMVTSAWTSLEEEASLVSTVAMAAFTGVFCFFGTLVLTFPLLVWLCRLVLTLWRSGAHWLTLKVLLVATVIVAGTAFVRNCSGTG